MKPSLQNLPEDVRQHLAKILLSSAERSVFDNKYLMDTENLATMISYAKVDYTYCRDIMKAMGNNLSPYHWRLRTLNDWISTCRELVFEVNLLKSRNIKLPPGLLRLPNLRKATIIAIPDQLSAVIRSPKLNELSVRLHSLSIWDKLVLTIRSLPLKVLRLDVDIIFKTNKLENMPKSELLRLSTACPSVDHLEITGYITLTPNLCSMIDAFRSLKKIGLKAKIASHHLRLLRELSEVDLYEPVSVSTAIGVGKSLVGLTMQDKTSEEIAELSACPLLRRLSLSIHDNAEAALAGVIDNVEELCLKWKLIYTGPDGSNGEVSPTLLYPKYYEPNGAVLVSIVSSARQIKSLKLVNAIVKGDTVRKLLEIAGRYLENIEMHVDWQKEPAVPRLELILHSIARYSPNLRTLNLLENCGYRGLIPVFATAQQKQSCLRAVEEVKLAAPRFTSHRVIKSFIEHRFVDKKYGNTLQWDDVLE